MSDAPEQQLQPAVKNKGGRPKGRKDNDKRISQKVKILVKSLYLTGELPDDIAKKIGINNAPLIKRWAREGKWDEERTKIMTVSSSTMIDTFLKDQVETFSGLQAIKKKSLDYIRNKSNLIGRHSEAVNAYIASVDLEYKMKSNTLHAKFLSEVANVLKKHIQDRNLLADILDDLVAVYEGYTQKNLSENRTEDARPEEN